MPFSDDLPKGHSNILTWSKYSEAAAAYLKKQFSSNIGAQTSALAALETLKGDVKQPWSRMKPDEKPLGKGAGFVTGVDAINTKIKNQFDPVKHVVSTVNLKDYADGKVRKARDDAGMSTWDCTITIPEDIRTTIESLGAGIGIDQIKGILNEDPILISKISKQVGNRCIKPEPYGWIFSTSQTLRLIDPKTDVQSPRPTALNFTKTDTGH